MKKLYYYLSVMLLVVAPLLMSSCHDGDVERAIYLSGSWTGDMKMYYGIEDRHGHYVEFDASLTDIVFYPEYEYATYGYGKQVDWYDEGPYERQYYYFEWRVRNGVLELYYPEDKDLDTKIYDYDMANGYFTGYFGNSNTKFRLRKVEDYYWDPYYDDCYMYWSSDCWYDYFYDDPYYWSPYTRASQETTNTEAVEGKIVKRGSRYNQ